MSKTIEEQRREAASTLGRIGGAAGRGKSKRRPTKQYFKMLKARAEHRRLDKLKIPREADGRSLTLKERQLIAK